MTGLLLASSHLGALSASRYVPSHTHMRLCHRGSLLPPQLVLPHARRACTRARRQRRPSSRGPWPNWMPESLSQPKPRTQLVHLCVPVAASPTHDPPIAHLSAPGAHLFVAPSAGTRAACSRLATCNSRIIIPSISSPSLPLTVYYCGAVVHISRIYTRDS